MSAQFFSFILRGLSVYRWSNFPRVERPTALDHVGFSMHVAFLLADLLENENQTTISTEAQQGTQDNTPISRTQIFLHSLNSLAFNCAYSDIHSDVKRAIKTKRPDLFEILQKKMMNSVLAWNLPNRVHESILEYSANFSSEEKTLEQDIFAYSKLVSAYFEATSQARVYPEIYAKAVQGIEERFRQPRFERFLAVLDVTRDTGLTKYLLSVRRLESAYRWNRLKRSYPVSVMSHLYLVALLSFFLFRMENRSNEEVEEALMCSFLHDVPEAITGDIITPTKKAAPGLDELIAEIEKEFVHDSLITHLQGYPFQEEYAQRLLEPWSGQVGKLVKQADLLCAFLESKIEELENPLSEQFRNSGFAVARRIRDVGSPAAKELLNQFEGGMRIYMPDSSLGLQ